MIQNKHSLNAMSIRAHLIEGLKSRVLEHPDVGLHQTIDSIEWECAAIANSSNYSAVISSHISIISANLSAPISRISPVHDF